MRVGCAANRHVATSGPDERCSVGRGEAVNVHWAGQLQPGAAPRMSAIGIQTMLSHLRNI